MKNKSVGEVIQALDARTPVGTAEDWDNVGLLVGDPSWKTGGAVVSIDLTPQAIQAAKKKGYRLIINHHPCIFPKNRGLNRVTAGSWVYEALREGIAVYSTHTNFDRCALEVPSRIAKGLGLEPKGRLLDKPAGSMVKLLTFVPESHLEVVRRSICEAGAGQIGNYDFCTFASPGQGTFRGNLSTQPFIGEPGKLESASEFRLETIFPRGLEKRVLAALFRAHPYEEPAYDLIAVEQAPTAIGWVKGLGYGFWGEFTRAKSFSDLSRDVKSLFNVDGFWVTDPQPSRIKRVGFVAGKGASFVGAAAAAGCDVFITGEAGYHTVLDASKKGMAVIELGHRESEVFFLSTVKEWLSQEGLKSVTLNLPTQKIWK